MFYCRNCKTKSEAPFCQTCGTPFTTADEIINCPNCNKMFFKPSRDFACTKCGTMVYVNPQNSMGMAQNQVVQPNAMPQNNQNVGFNQQNVQPNAYNNGAFQQNVQPNVQPNIYNNGVIQPQNANPQQFAQNQAVPPYMQTYANNNNQFEQNGNMMQNQAQNAGYQEQNNGYQQIAQQTTAEQNQQDLANEYLNTNTDVENMQNQSSSDDFMSLFSSSDVKSEEGEVNNEGTIDFDSLRSSDKKDNSDEKVFSEDGKMYDENGYEIVQAEGGDGAQASKKGKKSKGASASGGKAGKGIKIFALVEFVLLLGCIVLIGYLSLGQYIVTPNPCERAWSEYVNAQNIVATENVYKESIAEVQVSDNGNFALYKITGEDTFVIFSINNGLKIGSFLNMSKAQVEVVKPLSEITSSGYDDVKLYFADYIKNK